MLAQDEYNEPERRLGVSTLIFLDWMDGWYA
jgi:hypothetical protein